MNPKPYLFGVIAYLLVSFATQSASHFAINAAHYESVSFMRPEPIMPLGMLTMLLQGICLVALYLRWGQGQFSLTKGLQFGLLAGLFFVSYPALVEPAKYTVPSISAWALIEGSVGLIQFTLFGLALGKFVRLSSTGDGPQQTFAVANT